MAFWHRAHSDMCLFSASYSRINPCFTARRRIWVWNCHGTREPRKTTIFTSIVYGNNPHLKNLGEQRVVGRRASLHEQAPEAGGVDQAIQEMLRLRHAAVELADDLEVLQRRERAFVVLGWRRRRAEADDALLVVVPDFFDDRRVLLEADGGPLHDRGPGLAAVVGRVPAARRVQDGVAGNRFQQRPGKHDRAVVFREAFDGKWVHVVQHQAPEHGAVLPDSWQYELLTYYWVNLAKTTASAANLKLLQYLRDGN